MTRPIHLTVERRWRLVRLASRAGVAGAAASVAAWAVGAAPLLHLGAILLGALAAAAWPVRSDERRALRWVGDRVGLAYETAWELATDDRSRVGAGDPTAVVGTVTALRTAVAVQGRLVVRDLRPPPVSSWWVPLATVAFGLWAWAAWGIGGAPVPAPGPGTPPPSSVGAPVSSDPETVAPEAADAADLPEVDSDTPAGDPGASAGAAGGGGGAGGGASDGAPSERDALERFLDNLRERPPEAEEEEEEQPRAADAVTGEPTERGDEEAPPAAPVAAPREAGGDPGERADGVDEGAEGEVGDESDADGDAADVGGEGELGEGSDDGSMPGEGREVAGDADPLAGDPNEPGALGDPDPGGDAGIGVTAPGEGGEPTGPAFAEVESLPSILGPGPEQAIGGVLLPGVAPEGEAFPAGAAGADYRRAVERALNEGEVPVPYQDVIRNYFR